MHRFRAGAHKVQRRCTCALRSTSSVRSPNVAFKPTSELLHHGALHRSACKGIASGNHAAWRTGFQSPQHRICARNLCLQRLRRLLQARYTPSTVWTSLSGVQRPHWIRSRHKGNKWPEQI